MIYGNITDWRAYALARGNTAPTNASDTDATAALQRASDYIRLRYVVRLDLEGTEDSVIEATYIAAGYDIDKPGFWTATYTPGIGKVLTEVKGIKWTLAGGSSSVSGGTADAMLPLSPAIEALFAGYGGVASTLGAMVV